MAALVILYIEEKFMKNKIISTVRHMLFAGYYAYSAVAVPVIYNRAYRKGELKYLSKEDFEVWKKAMFAMLKEYCSVGYNFRVRQVIYAFANSKIEVVRKTDAGSSDIPIVVLCIRNDLKRIQMLVDHYRKLGVEKFAFMDNGSDDGTFEWLMDQPDIDLFRCYEHYQTAVKEGWINRIVSHYGFDRWYIVTDSDELMVYEGMEEHPLFELTKVLSRSGTKRVKGLTLDTYAEGQLFGKTENIRKDYRWIDTDSYQEADAVAGKERIKRFVGGPRYRLMKSTITISKFPLVYWDKGTVSDSAHFQYPHDLINKSPCFAGILHFKFIDKDLSEFEKRAQKNSGFSTGGTIYKQYMDFAKNAKDTSFMYDGSIEFTASEALRKISLIKKVNF